MPRRRMVAAEILVGLSLCAALFAQQDQRNIPQSDTSVIDADGTARVTRVVPVPTTVSPEAQKSLARIISDVAKPETMEENRTRAGIWQSKAGADARALYPVNISEETIAGVPAKIFTPATIPAAKRDRVLINIHGGGFVVDAGSLTESIPIANLTQTKVVSVLYRLAPEHPFPAAVDDVVAVYKELLKTHSSKKIAVYGTSAGAILTAEVAAKLKQLGLPLPAALGVFSGLGDLSKVGDSSAIYALAGLAGPLTLPSQRKPSAYAGATDLHDPILSPIYGDLKGFPPTLFVTSTRDMLLSGTTILHRAFLRSGVDGQLVVFEALPHAFWNDASLPESKEANQIMADFFDKHLGK